MAQGPESQAIIHPTLHHFGVVTRHLEEMVDWYAKVVGMVMLCQKTFRLINYQQRGSAAETIRTGRISQGG